MILSKYTKMDISVFGKSKCLLTKPTGNIYLSCSNEEGGLFGAYVLYDTNKEEWVWAGKATAAGKGNKTGRMKWHWCGHNKRHKAHVNDDDSQYYDIYPSKENIWSNNLMNAGLFEIFSRSSPLDLRLMTLRRHCLRRTMLVMDYFPTHQRRRYQWFIQTPVESWGIRSCQRWWHIFLSLDMISLSAEATMYRRVRGWMVVDWGSIKCVWRPLLIAATMGMMSGSKEHGGCTDMDKWYIHRYVGR